MGLIKALKGAVGGAMADQWREYFYCEAMPSNVIAAKGRKKTSGRSSNKKGSENVITNGSVIAVNEGQCMMIVEQGKVVDVCAEAGEYIYDMSTEPSLFFGDLSQSIGEVFSNIGKRFTFGGDTAKDQRVYYFNTKELMGNKYGTPSPVPFRVVDSNVGLDIDISIRCFGEYSYRVVNPILFYTNVCGNIEYDYTRDRIDGQLKSELMTALQPAFGKLSAMGIRYSALPAHTAEIAGALNDVLSQKWSDLRGIKIVSFGVSSVKASDEDEAMIKELQRTAAFRNPTMAAAHMVNAQAEAMKSAAANTSTGPAMAFMNMGMAANTGGFNAQNLFAMGQQQNQTNNGQGQVNGAQQYGGQNQSNGGYQQSTQSGVQSSRSGARAGAWTCSCGAVNQGKFCTECGNPKPAAADGWTCSCGAVNKGKFCTECGKKKPAGVPQYRCDKCGWEPSDKAHPPKFCPECGDPFDDGDRI